jgi:NAD(P)-dependent dehydrogenase (short-subunit alcohol dehydrogenase family)
LDTGLLPCRLNGFTRYSTSSNLQLGTKGDSTYKLKDNQMTTTVLDRFRLDGKAAIVTGASSGLGIAFAEALAEAGADLVLTARRTDRLEQTRALIQQRGRRALTVTADVARPEDAQAVVDAAMAEFGHVDVLVNNAGKGTAVPATRESPDQFREVIDINLNGSYWMAQACGRVMKPGSSIINVASVVALTSGGLPQAAYSASKAGVMGLTRDLAVQWTGRKGIRVNALAPGFFPSEMTDQFPEGYIDSQLPRVPAGRPGDPDELAAALVFLASPAASYVTGTTLVVDGGLTVS